MFTPMYHLSQWLTCGIGTSERKDDTLHCKSGREEPSRTWVGLFEEDDFGTRSTGEVCSEFQVDGSRGKTKLRENEY